MTERLLTPAELAEYLAVDRAFVYEHAVELGGETGPDHDVEGGGRRSEPARGATAAGIPSRLASSGKDAAHRACGSNGVSGEHDEARQPSVATARADRS